MRALFDRTNFVLESSASFELKDDIVHDEATFRIRARLVDHDIPCLAFAIEEKAHVNAAKDRLDALGVSTGRGCAISSTRYCRARLMAHRSTSCGAIVTATMQ